MSENLANGSPLRGPGCFLIGSGPSLNAVNVNRLAGFWTISFNRSHIAWNEWGFDPTFFAWLDEDSLPIRAEEVKDLIPRSKVRRFFLNRVGLDYGIEPSERVTLVGHQPGAPFSTDLNDLSHYGSVGASSLQLLAGLGFQRITLLGIDGHYRQVGDKKGVEPFLVEQDLDHFHSEYSRFKRPMSDEMLDTMAKGWVEVAQACQKLEQMDVRIASPGTSLTCFEPIDFEDALSWIGVREPVGDKAAIENLRPEMNPDR